MELETDVFVYVCVCSVFIQNSSDMDIAEEREGNSIDMKRVIMQTGGYLPIDLFILKKCHWN